jgi:hypothetical protein
MFFIDPADEFSSVTEETELLRRESKFPILLYTEILALIVCDVGICGFIFLVY